MEIEEIQFFLKQFIRENNLSLHNKYFSNQQNILDIIQHYFTQIKCEECKYIHGVKLVKWDKKKEIELFLNNNVLDTDKIDKIYNIYCKQKEKNGEKDTIISKIYFMKHTKQLTINK